MADKTVVPGIMPMVAYKYDALRTIPKTPRSDTYLAELDARFRHWKALWNMAKFVDSQGRDWVVEGGVMWAFMYDFCGGLTVSSAFARARQVQNDPWGYAWRMNPHGPLQSYNPTSILRPGFEEIKDVIPDLSAYTGSAVSEQSEAENFMRNSVAASICTIAERNQRRGVFAGDRTSSNGMTRLTMQRATTVPHIYFDLPGIEAYAGEMYEDDEGVTRTKLKEIKPRTWLCNLRNVKADFDGGKPYRNPNTGSTVAVCSLVVQEGSSVKGPLKEWTLPEEEQRKFLDPKFLQQCPQNLFHNG